jgi:pimeloyl-ACP methyl ester carboxylesterase
MRPTPQSAPTRPPARHYPLAALRGALPTAPPWFRDAIAVKPDRTTFIVSGLEIEVLLWGDAAKPGLVFLHGDGAHADWWSFVAPFFAQDWRCVAISWSGMGASGRRTTYSLESYAEEVLAAVRFASFNAAPVVVAHSLGGYPALIAGADPGAFRAIVLVDTGFVAPPKSSGLIRTSPRPHPFFPTLEAALARFRVQPAEFVQNDYIIDHIARASFWPVAEGWTWRFDPRLLSMSVQDLDRFPALARCPLAYIRGERSPLLDAEGLARLTQLLPPDSPIVAVPEAGHHVMIDQPLAFVAALRALLARRYA